MVNENYSTSLNEFTTEIFGGVSGSSVASIITYEFKESLKTSILICASDQQAQETYNQIKFFNKELSKSNILYLPSLETLPYDLESPHSELIAERAKVFHETFLSILSAKENKKTEPKLIVTSITTLLQKICSSEHWVSSSVTIVKDQNFNLSSIVNCLSELGYQENSLEATTMCSFFKTNENVDIYSSSQDYPVRIKTHNGKITSMRKIDITTQITFGEELQELKLLPAREIPVSNKGVKKFKFNYRKAFGRALGDITYESVNRLDFPNGIESLLPLFDDGAISLLEAIQPLKPSVYMLDGAKEAVERYMGQISKRFSELKGEKDRPILHPNEVWMDGNKLTDILRQLDTVIVRAETSKDDSKTFETKLTNITRSSEIREIMKMLSVFTVEAKKTIVFIHSDVRLRQIETLFSLLDKDTEICSSWDEAINSDVDTCIIEADINIGFYDSQKQLFVVTEKEIFGQPIQAKDEDGVEKTTQLDAEDLKYLNPGDLVVHLNEGIGRYAGLKVLSLGGSEKEYFTIDYADSAKAFVNLNDLHLVSRYSGADPEKIKLDGKDQAKWGSKVEEAIKHIQGTALQLLQAQIKRKKKKGIAFDKPKRPYNIFCQEFPYQPTSDQIKVSTEIADDLASETPMDRLVAGDVGFGKTEIAMRAAFLAVSSNYQAVMMAPSTILVHQHYESFKARYQNTKFKIVELSGSSNNKEALKMIESGEADIIIGTHKAIQKSVKYKKLGLLIVDEEHRFGVKAKEQLRFIANDLNVLSMTATPIPRSLSMSMNGIRDMSVLAVPPAKRLSIRTQVKDPKESVLAEAIDRELMRNGQIFYVHNNTTTIYDKANEIQQQFPNLRIAVGHGKMHSLELEKVMSDFYKHEYDILVATTIIETGIDIPNANTILIENAENFGIASLHQLRGRVGRSHHQGYAYLLKGKSAEAETSIKRLSAMESASQLGDGFTLANHDLAIRGAGEILGDEQSGHMSRIGYELYDKILRHAIRLIEENNGKPLTDNQVESLRKGYRETMVDLGINGLISSSYIRNEQLRLSLYRQISLIDSLDEATRLENELIDRFGEIPLETKMTLELSKLKLSASKIGISELKLLDNGGTIKVKRTADTSNKLFDFISKYPGDIELSSPYEARIVKRIACPEQRMSYTKQVIKEFA